MAECPTCGCPVTVHYGEEGTSYYRPDLEPLLSAVPADVVKRIAALEAALRQITALRSRFHPIAGYQFDRDPRGIASDALKGTDLE